MLNSVKQQTKNNKNNQNQVMFEQSYESEITKSLSLIYNESLPYTLVYEAEREMSLAGSIDLTIGDFTEDLTISQSVSESLADQNDSSNNQSLIATAQCTYHAQFYIPRSHLEIRNSYLSKLMTRGFISEKPKKKYRHLFVFDWDDTLLCTSYLNHFKFSQLREKDYQMLQAMDNYASKILELCMEKGEVTIITNAAKGWVEYSSQKFLPKTYQTINAKKIAIISARQEYADQFPNEIRKWKVSAFQKLNSIENNHLITNIICIGDSTIEMEAGQILASSFEKSLLKTVKFRESPRIEQLLKQQQLLEKKLQEIVNTAKNLTIRLERKGTK